MIFEPSEWDRERAFSFLIKNGLLPNLREFWDKKPFICIAPFANTVGNSLSIDDYKVLKEHYENIVYFGGLNNQEIPWAIDGRGTSFGEMVSIASRSIGIFGLESGPTYLMSTLKEVPLIIFRNPYSFPLHKQGLIKCGFRTENIKEIIVTKEDDKNKLFEEAIIWTSGT
jgi:hypothetical protein